MIRKAHWAFGSGELNLNHYSDMANTLHMSADNIQSFVREMLFLMLITVIWMVIIVFTTFRNVSICKQMFITSHKFSALTAHWGISWMYFYNNCCHDLYHTSTIQLATTLSTNCNVENELNLNQQCLHSPKKRRLTSVNF